MYGLGFERKKAIRDEDKYAWFHYEAKTPLEVQSRKGSAWLLKLTEGTRFGVRVATSSEGKYRVILPGQKNKVFTISESEMRSVQRRSKMVLH